MLPRAAALAAARDAVRQSRARRAERCSAERVQGAPGRPPRDPLPPERERVVRAVRARARQPGGAGDGSGSGSTGDADGRDRGGGGRPSAASPAAPSAAPSEVRSTLPAYERARLALRERLPLWLQLRCGVEPKSLLALALVLVVAAGFGVHHFWTGRPAAVRAPEARTAPAGSAAHGAGVDTGAAKDAGQGAAGQGPPGRKLVVDVAGKVRRPGIYRLPSGARVADALKSAGGLRPGTDVTGVVSDIPDTIRAGRAAGVTVVILPPVRLDGDGRDG